MVQHNVNISSRGTNHHFVELPFIFNRCHRVASRRNPGARRPWNCSSAYNLGCQWKYLVAAEFTFLIQTKASMRAAALQNKVNTRLHAAAPISIELMIFIPVPHHKMERRPSSNSSISLIRLHCQLVTNNCIVYCIVSISYYYSILLKIVFIYTALQNN